MKKSIISAALIGGLVVAGSGTGFAQQAKAATSSSVVNLAQNGIGQKYVWGANDCSGFTKKVFGQLGINLPHSSAAQASYGAPVSQANLQPGDLVFFNTSGAGISHVGIYVGNNRMISAENENTGVRATQIFNGGASSYWAPKYVTARRVVSSQQAPQQTAKKAAAPKSASTKAAISYHPAASIKSAATPSAQNASTYKIQSGDTLSEISLKVNVSVANLKAINGLSSDQINAGQVLKLKGQAVQTAKTQPAATAAKSTAATVKTASSQAKPATSQAATKATTEAASKTTTAKTTTQAKTTAAQTASRSVAKAAHGTYVVNAGDSLWAISRDNGISVAQIKTANHLNSDTIYAGQKLTVAQPAKVSKKYSIKKGDTLWDIAVAHHTTVFKLVEANHIQSTLIFPNQQLVIPEK
ncbi:LysM peptidoglycan-binding domain-containing protein [Sporolactobacillus vineae]|uniref:LysM peptidoglycan-binding domain-containing protein n=1 Tax=Sporolactobacillus vineae TaxID=444463 RepID=UPI00028834AC|nr:LysM peptidoglycan-binding domain-containing protein [Sporolactobacillus vineae]